MQCEKSQCCIGNLKHKRQNFSQLDITRAQRSTLCPSSSTSGGTQFYLTIHAVCIDMQKIPSAQCTDHAAEGCHMKVHITTLNSEAPTTPIMPS